MGKIKMSFHTQSFHQSATKGKNEMLTVLNALQNYLLDVEGKKY